MAELARPVSGEPRRGLVLFPDILGLRPLFDSHCQRLADENDWTVCAPEPWPGRERLSLEERIESVGTLDDTAVLADVLAAADACEIEPVSMIGFCMGGMYTLKATALGRFDRVVAFYPMIKVPEQWRSLGQGEPLDALRSPGACPSMAIIGTADVWTPPDDIRELEAAGTLAVVYDGAEHGFVHDPDRPSFRPDDAGDAWHRAIGFLAQ